MDRKDPVFPEAAAAIGKRSAESTRREREREGGGKEELVSRRNFPLPSRPRGSLKKRIYNLLLVLGHLKIPLDIERISEKGGRKPPLTRARYLVNIKVSGYRVEDWRENSKRGISIPSPALNSLVVESSISDLYLYRIYVENFLSSLNLSIDSRVDRCVALREGCGLDFAIH